MVINRDWLQACIVAMGHVGGHVLGAGVILKVCVAIVVALVFATLALPRSSMLVSVLLPSLFATCCCVYVS